MREYANILNINIKEAINNHKSIIKKISKKWGFNEICFFYFFLPFNLEKQILNIRYLINEFSLPFIEKEDKFIIENNLYRSLEKSKEGDKIRNSLQILKNNYFPFKEFELKIIKQFHVNLINYNKPKTILFNKDKPTKILNINLMIKKKIILLLLIKIEKLITQIILIKI